MLILYSCMGQKYMRRGYAKRNPYIYDLYEFMDIKGLETFLKLIVLIHKFFYKNMLV
jgi:hypothetical protein